MRTCVRDLMKLYSTFMAGFNDQIETGKTATEGIPLKQVAQLMSAKVPFNAPSRNEASYALGWGRVQSPGRMGQIGINPGLMEDGMPVVGEGIASRLIPFHQGSLPGALSSVMLLPDTSSAIVVLSNTPALNDVPDSVGQLVLEEFLDVPKSDRNDYIGAAKGSVAENLKWYPNLVQRLEEARTKGTSPGKLETYTGRYRDPAHVFVIVVTIEKGALYWALQSMASETYRLTHYEYDTFTWLQPRNDLSKRGRWVGTDQPAPYWKVRFSKDADGDADRLFWVHDAGVPAVEYRKQNEDGAKRVSSHL